jgi:hypothetical protein
MVWGRQPLAPPHHGPASTAWRLSLLAAWPGDGRPCRRHGLPSPRRRMRLLGGKAGVIAGFAAEVRTWLVSLG